MIGAAGRITPYTSRMDVGAFVAIRRKEVQAFLT
jgi:hypothetical protein